MDERAESKHETNEFSVSALDTERPTLDRMRSSDLVDTVANHIVPRLLLAHRMDAREVERSAEVRRPPSAEDVASLAERAVAQDVPGAMRETEVRLRGGMTLEALLLDWIAAAARLLGDQWLRDERSFSEVTLGLGTLHRVLATLRHRLGPPLSHRGVVVLLTAPGEQHTLAIHVLGDLLRHVGWEAVVKPNLGEDELLTMVATEPVVMVGISVSSADLIDPLDRLVARVREVSLNRELAVMLGGAIDLSSYAEGIGAVFCPSARTALSWLERRARLSL